MARRAERPAIFSDSVDRVIQRMLVTTVVVLLTALVVVNLWRTIVR